MKNTENLKKAHDLLSQFFDKVIYCKGNKECPVEEADNVFSNDYVITIENDVWALSDIYKEESTNRLIYTGTYQDIADYFQGWDKLLGAISDKNTTPYYLGVYKIVFMHKRLLEGEFKKRGIDYKNQPRIKDDK